MKTTKIEFAVYAQQCVMAGRVCHNPEGKYGDDWRESHDLLYFGGTADELRELADSYAKGGTFDQKIARLIRDEIEANS